MTKRLLFGATLFGLGLVSLVPASVPDWVKLAQPQAPEKAAAFADIQSVACRRALSMWANARAGEIVPYVDADGRRIAYMFHYRIDDREFPDYATAASEVAAELPTLSDPRNHSRYAHVLVSARYDRAPILRYGEGSSEFFITLERARRRAGELIGNEPVLTRVYYVWPLSYYEFSSSEGELAHLGKPTRSIVIEAHVMNRTFSVAEFQAYVRTGAAEARRMTLSASPIELAELEAVCETKMRAEWNRCLTDASAFDTIAVYVPGHQLAPFYDWSYGCSPTSGTMVAGYLDHALGYGRCIYDFLQRWDPVEHNMNWQIPWAQQEMAFCFGTDTMSGGTSVYGIGPGLMAFGENKGYTFEVFEASGAGYNDWAWASDSDEISNGYSMVWSALWAVHSLAAYGIRMPSKDIYVHNTWWAPADWWHYTNGDVNAWAFVASVHPSGGSDHRLRLTYPRGDTLYNHNGAGEILWAGRTATITWDNAGQPNDSVTIGVSTDAGMTWQNLFHGLPDNGSYPWDIARSTLPGDQLRMRIKAFLSGNYIAGDGTQGNFRIATVPLPPQPRSPPSGRPLTSPPVVLVVDTISYVDSFNFVVYTGGDTLFRTWQTATICTVPDTLFENNHPYSWVCRAHNSFGWGSFSSPWSFWIRFSAVREESGPMRSGEFEVRNSAWSQPVVVRFVLNRPAPVRLVVYDVAGRPVRTLASGRFATGAHEVAWNRTDERNRAVPSGCYFVGLSAGGQTSVRKTELVR
jgi:hypothetical protein